MVTKPYKMEERYFIADLEDVENKLRVKLDSLEWVAWECLPVLEWFEERWDAQPFDYRWFIQAAREITWLEVLVITGWSERQIVEIYSQQESNEPSSDLQGVD